MIFWSLLKSLQWPDNSNFSDNLYSGLRRILSVDGSVIKFTTLSQERAETDWECLTLRGWEGWDWLRVPDRFWVAGVVCCVERAQGETQSADPQCCWPGLERGRSPGPRTTSQHSGLTLCQEEPRYIGEIRQTGRITSLCIAQRWHKSAWQLFSRS